MTENEAKQRWCPMVRCDKRKFPTNRGSYNDDDQAEETANCIGSACMLWREYDGYAEGSKLRQGFCGLAGAPVPFKT